MSASTSVAALDEARSRIDRLVDRLRTRADLVQAASERLTDAVERVHDSEHAAAGELTAAKHRVVAARRHAESGASLAANVVDEAHSQLADLGSRLLELDIAKEAAETQEHVGGHLAALAESASSASGAVEETHTALAESRGTIEHAVDEFTTATGESSDSTAHSADALKAALDAAADHLKHSMSDAAETFATKGADFRGGVDHILNNTVQSGLRDIGVRSREYIEQAIRAKVKAVVRELVHSLLDALKSFRAHGSDVGSATSDSDGKFGHMGHAHVRTASSADRVHAEKERLEKEKAKKDAEGDDE